MKKKCSCPPFLRGNVFKKGREKPVSDSTLNPPNIIPYFHWIRRESCSPLRKQIKKYPSLRQMAVQFHVLSTIITHTKLKLKVYLQQQK